jgi:hypothetical protein
MLVHVTKFIWGHVIEVISFFVIILENIVAALFIICIFFDLAHLWLMINSKNVFALMILETHTFCGTITLRSIFLYQNCIQAYSRYRSFLYRRLIRAQQISLLLILHFKLLIKTLLKNTSNSRNINLRHLTRSRWCPSNRIFFFNC